MAEKEKPGVFNPNLEKEVVSGLVNSLLFLLGVVINVFGFGLAVWNRILGDVVWLVGSVLIVLMIIRNVKSIHGKGFRIANMVIKVLFLLLSTFLIILINLAISGSH